eukprot:1058018-Pelagomonas_calceolata.AAC.8
MAELALFPPIIYLQISCLLIAIKHTGGSLMSLVSGVSPLKPAARLYSERALPSPCYYTLSSSPPSPVCPPNALPVGLGPAHLGRRGTRD